MGLEKAIRVSCWDNSLIAFRYKGFSLIAFRYKGFSSGQRGFTRSHRGVRSSSEKVYVQLTGGRIPRRALFFS